MLTGRLVDHSDALSGDVGGLMKRLVTRLGEPVVRGAIGQGIRLLGRQFVMGRTIAEARQRARDDTSGRYRYSYDMLGEAARTAAIADNYESVYAEAIDNLADDPVAGTVDAPSISVKLSALHPRFEFSQAGRVMRELTPRVLNLARAARDSGIAFTIDAEEADRLDLTLDVFEIVSRDPSLADWPGLGLAVQAYQKRAIYVLDWLDELARSRGQRIPMRLVKGAYWDTEIKRAQQGGFDDYPVFTRKAATDVSYLACARRLLASPDSFYPRFATHNAHSIASIIEMAGESGDFEFQRLHGMGESLYDQVIATGGGRIPCRVYAPVGSYEDLLPYLVRRLLENGANTSFVHHVVDPSIPIDDLIADPVERTQGHGGRPHPRIPRPPDLYGTARRNSRGLDLSDANHLALVETAIRTFEPNHAAAPIVGGQESANPSQPVADPADHGRRAGTVIEAGPRDIESALARAHEAAPGWDAVPAGDRAATLEHLASLLEDDMTDLIALCAREAGKTLDDGLSEVREAVDFVVITRLAPGPSLPSPRHFLARQVKATRYRCTAACVRLYQPVELPLGDISWAGDGGSRGRQCSRRKAGRADASHRRNGCASCASRRRTR